MNPLIPSLVALTPFISTSIPNANRAGEIMETYRPAIEFREVGRDLSLYGCAIEELEIVGQDPVTLKTRKVNVSLYRGRGTNGSSAVLILPPTGGVNILDRGYANELCYAGITVALVSGWEFKDEVSLDFSMHNKGALRAIAASRHVVEFLNMNKFASIGMLGTSIGAISGSLVMGFEPRISATAFIVGSGRLADVIAESDEQGAIQLRQERFKAFGFKTVEDYKRALREAIWVEPLKYINRLGTRAALVVSADADTTVQSSYQFELAQLLKAENHIRLKGGHRQVIKDTFFSHRGEIVNFFRRNLKGVAQ
jgi:hypothetical protein